MSRSYRTRKDLGDFLGYRPAALSIEEPDPPADERLHRLKGSQ